MRPSASLCQSSRYRLLTLLFVLLLEIPCALTVGGGSFPHFSEGHEVEGFRNVREGGTPLVGHYHLMSQCSSHVQITPSRGRHAINALGDNSSDFALLSFQSITPRDLRILGEKTQKYLCFSRNGKLIARYNGRSKRCWFQQLVNKNSSVIMLQSSANPEWFVGFNKLGSSKRGHAMKKAMQRYNSISNSSNSNNSNSSSIGSRHQQHQDQTDASRPVLVRHMKKRRRRRKYKRQMNRRRRPRHDLSSDSPSNRGKLSPKNRSQRKDPIRCFTFLYMQTEQNPSDPRWKNAEENKKSPFTWNNHWVEHNGR